MLPLSYKGIQGTQISEILEINLLNGLEFSDVVNRHLEYKTVESAGHFFDYWDQGYFRDCTEDPEDDKGLSSKT